jgi:PAS domain S-box-containing protein
LKTSAAQYLEFCVKILAEARLISSWIEGRSEERLRQCCDAIAAGIVVQDVQGKITFANRAACEILGLEPDRLLGSTCCDPVWQAIREDGSPFPGREHPPMVALATGRPVRKAVIGLYAQQPERLRWILVDSEPVAAGDSGTPAEVVTTFVDITEWKRSREALSDSERRFRGLVEATSDWVWEVDENLRYTYVSPKVQDLLGYRPEELLGRSPFVLMPPAEAVRVQALITDLVKSHRPLTAVENVCVHKEGRLVVLETSGRPIFDTDGVFRGYRGIDRDIAGRKQAEEALRRSEAFIRMVTDLVPARIAYLDTEQRYRFVNKRYEEWFGVPKEQILGKHVSELLGAALYERILPYVQRVLAGEEVAYDLAVDAGNGRQRYLRVVYVPHPDEDGRVAGFYASLEDTTEQKRLEEQLRQSQKMEAVGKLAGGIAHDFNNLLTVIAGYSRLVRGQLGPEHPLAESVAEIERAGERAAALTRQLLAFSRKQVLQPRILDLNSVVAGMDALLRRLIGEHIELQMTLDPGLGQVRADPGQIEQVVLNLAVNARDAMAEGGRLTIETKNAGFDKAKARQHPGLEPGYYAMLAISDTGQGMDAETRNHLFEPFFTTKALGRGTGLGLSTIYGIVKQSGGHIWVHSEPGQGTTFRIYLPRIEARPEPGRSSRAVAGPALGTETILLVEDETAVRKLFRAALASRGYTVLEAADGEDAILVAEQYPGPIQLLVTDVMMPRMGGPELACRLASLRPETKTLYVSGYASSAPEACVPGAAFLQKPFTPDALALAVGQLLDAPGAPTA